MLPLWSDPSCTIYSVIELCDVCTLYNYTVHCTIRTRAQSVRRQHRKRTSEKSEKVTNKNTFQVARNMDFHSSELKHWAGWDMIC